MKIGGLRIAGASPVADGGIDLILLDTAPVFPAPGLIRRIQRQPAAVQPRELGTLTLRLEVDPANPDGTTGCVIGVNLTLNDAVQASELGTLPWPRLVAAATAALNARNTNSIAAWQATGAAQVAAQPRQPSGRGRGRPPLAPTHYHDIAKRYWALIQEGESAPTKRIAEQDQVSRSTAAGWVRRARQKGFLNDATPGKAG